MGKKGRRKAVSAASEIIEPESQGLSPYDLKRKLQLTQRAIQKKDIKKMFSSPITDAVAPGYSQIIAKPMDFYTINKKIASESYTMFREYMSDVALVIQNCMTYNMGETSYFKYAAKLAPVFEKIFSKELGITFTIVLPPPRTEPILLRDIIPGYESSEDESDGEESVENETNECEGNVSNSFEPVNHLASTDQTVAMDDDRIDGFVTEEPNVVEDHSPESPEICEPNVASPEDVAFEDLPPQKSAPTIGEPINVEYQTIVTDPEEQDQELLIEPDDTVSNNNGVPERTVLYEDQCESIVENQAEQTLCSTSEKVDAFKLETEIKPSLVVPLEVDVEQNSDKVSVSSDMSKTSGFSFASSSHQLPSTPNKQRRILKKRKRNDMFEFVDEEIPAKPLNDIPGKSKLSIEDILNMSSEPCGDAEDVGLNCANEIVAKPCSPIEFSDEEAQLTVNEDNEELVDEKPEDQPKNEETIIEETVTDEELIVQQTVALEQGDNVSTIEAEKQNLNNPEESIPENTEQVETEEKSEAVDELRLDTEPQPNDSEPTIFHAGVSVEPDAYVIAENNEQGIKPEIVIEPPECPILPTTSEASQKEITPSEDLINGFALPDTIDTAAIEAEIECQNTTTIVPQNLEAPKVPIIPEITPEQHLEAQLAASMIEMEECKSEVIDAIPPEFAVKEEFSVKAEPTPEPEVPVKRKRGRPPKPKDPSAISPVRSKRAKTSKKAQAEKAGLETAAEPQQQQSQEFIMPDMVEPSPLMMGHQLQDLPGCSAEYNSNYSQSNYMQSQSYSISNQQLTPNSTEYGQFLTAGQCTNAVFYPDVNAPLQTSANQVVYHPNCLEGVPIGSQGSVYVNGPLGTTSEPVICQVPQIVPGEPQQLPSFSQLVTPQLAPKQGSLDSRDVPMSPSFNPTSMCSSMESSIAHISPSILTFTPSTAMNYESSPTATKYFDDLFVTPVKPPSNTQPITNLNLNAPQVPNSTVVPECSQPGPSVETTSSKRSSKRTGSAAANEAPASKHTKTQSGFVDSSRSSTEAGSTTTQLPYVQIQINNRKYKVPSNTPLAGSMQNPLGYLKNGGLTGSLSFLPKTPCVEKRLNVTKDCISSKSSPQKFQRLNEKSGPGRYRYLSYGPYGQTAPVKDKSRTFHKNSVHLDVLHSVYSGPLGLQFAESLKNFTSGMNPYMKGVVNEFLDSFTNGRHSMYESCQYLSLPYTDDSQLTVTDKEIRSLKTLKKLGIDTSFIDGSTPKISADTILKCVDSVIKTNACDDKQSARNLDQSSSSIAGEGISNTLPKSDVKTSVSHSNSFTPNSHLSRPTNQNLPRIESLASFVRESSSNSQVCNNYSPNVNSPQAQGKQTSSTSCFQSQSTISSNFEPKGSAWQNQPYIEISVPSLSQSNAPQQSAVASTVVDSSIVTTTSSQNVTSLNDLSNLPITSSESVNSLSIQVEESLPSSVEVSQSSRISSDLDFSNLLTFDNPTEEVATIPVCMSQNQSSSMEILTSNFVSNDLPTTESIPLTLSDEQNFINRFVDAVSDVSASQVPQDTRLLFDQSEKSDNSLTAPMKVEEQGKGPPITGLQSFANREETPGAMASLDLNPVQNTGQIISNSAEVIHDSQLSSFAEAQMSSTFEAAMEALTNNLGTSSEPTEGFQTPNMSNVNISNCNYNSQDHPTEIRNRIPNAQTVELSNRISTFGGPETQTLADASMQSENAKIENAQYMSNSTNFHQINHLSTYQNNLMEPQEASISNKCEPQRSQNEPAKNRVPTSEAISCETLTCSELSVSVPSDSFGSLFLTPSNQNGNNCHDSSMQLPSSISPFFDAFGHIEMLTTPNPDSKMSSSDDQSLPDFKFSPDLQPDTTTNTNTTNGPSSGHDSKESLQSSLCNGFAEDHTKCTTVATAVLPDPSSSKMSQFDEVKSTLPNPEQQLSNR